MDVFVFQHPLHPNSEIYLRFLGRAVGLERIGVTIARFPLGKKSFIHHAYQNEEEWVYILPGRGIAEIGNNQYEVEPGDFMGFELPQQPHHHQKISQSELTPILSEGRVYTWSK